MELLRNYFDKFGISCSEVQYKQFKDYMELLLDMNEHINLTAIKEPGEFILKHYVDSSIIYNSAEYGMAKNVLDLGTGGGFPGIPLAILSPEKEFILVDSLNKRIKAVLEMAEEIGLKNVKVVHGRAEDLGRNPKYRDHFDLCVSRAVANLAVLCEYCLPFVKEKGCFIAYKSGEIEEELQGSRRAIKVLKGELSHIKTFEIAENSRTIIVIEKVASTPKIYPRQAGKPGRLPIKK